MPFLVCEPLVWRKSSPGVIISKCSPSPKVKQEAVMVCPRLRLMKWVLNVFDAGEVAVSWESFWVAGDIPKVMVPVCMKIMSGIVRERIFIGILGSVTNT